jgi:hypothetical protein
MNVYIAFSFRYIRTYVYVLQLRVKECIYIYIYILSNHSLMLILSAMILSDKYMSAYIRCFSIEDGFLIWNFCLGRVLHARLYFGELARPLESCLAGCSLGR